MNNSNSQSIEAIELMKLVSSLDLIENDTHNNIKKELRAFGLKVRVHKVSGIGMSCSSVKVVSTKDLLNEVTQVLTTYLTTKDKPKNKYGSKRCFLLTYNDEEQDAIRA